MPSLPKSFSPKLIFFDIDGTLLNSKGQYSSSLASEMWRLKKQGVKLAIASGRPAIAAQFLFNDLPCIDAGLFCTGAELYAPDLKKHLQLHSLEKGLLPSLLDKVKTQGFYCECYTSEYYAVESFTELTRVHSEHLRVSPKLINFDSLLSQSTPITKLLLGVEEAIQGDSLRALSVDYPQLDFAFAHFLAYPGWLFASVVSNKANKHSAFDFLLDFHEVGADEVMAFGDSHSDSIFLERAGLGVARGNALPELQAKANITTLHCDQDGVAAILSSIG